MQKWKDILETKPDRQGYITHGAVLMIPGQHTDIMVFSKAFVHVAALSFSDSAFKVHVVLQSEPSKNGRETHHL